MLYESPVPVRRLDHRLEPNPARVISRFFSPGDERRIRSIIDRVLALDEEDVAFVLSNVREHFSHKHPEFKDLVAENYEAVKPHVPDADAISERRSLLIGAYFTMEYAIESAALFNPSMVPADRQDGVPDGSIRFVMSLRATGEGHVSSIVFRSGRIDADGNIEVEPASPFSRQLEVVEDRTYVKADFQAQLVERGEYTEAAAAILNELGEQFTVHDARGVIRELQNSRTRMPAFDEAVEDFVSLARSNYQMRLPDETDVSEIVIFPFSEQESQGIEDVRLVYFTEDDGSTRYYGTYTAYNGSRIFPQLLDIPTPATTVTVRTLGGCYARNKGLALFPRKLDGDYVMISRPDGENLYLMRSKSVRIWNEAQRLQGPKFFWEFVQIGNCGSPLETEAGWLLLTHGVGPMRTYCIGATLLDRDDPARIIGQTEQPLLVPTGSERIGYVPNVVYSCGGMIHGQMLYIPFAQSDISSSFAVIHLPDLLNVLGG
jgi:predicted GH43/DUF377 family glycosyl hydrolase